MSMSWTDLDSFKSLAPIIKVDKFYSFLVHVHSPWSTSKLSMIRLQVLHFWNLKRLRFKEIWDISLKMILRQMPSCKISILISHCRILLMMILHWECLILSLGLCRMCLDHYHCDNKVFGLISNTLILNRLGIRWRTKSICIDLWRRLNPYCSIINRREADWLIWNTGEVRIGWKYAGPWYPPSGPFFSVSVKQF
jgi:hypothetical protein